MRKGIFTKNYIAMSLLLLFSLLLLMVAFSGISYSFVRSEAQKTVSTTADVVADASSAKSVETGLNDWDLRMTISAIAEASGTHVSICDEDGVVLACSDSDVFCPHIGMNIEMQTLAELTSGEIEYVFTDLDGYYASGRYMACSIIENPYTEQGIGYVLASSATENITAIWIRVFLVFAVISVAVLIVGMLVSWVTIGRQVAPLKEMAAAAQAFGKGDMSVRVHVSDMEDEVGALGQAFNQMAVSLESAEQQRRELIANVSHELKTPMTTIAGYADGLLDGTIPWEGRERYLMVISDETRRLSRLVRKMLDMSKAQSGIQETNRNARCPLCETVRMAILGLEGRITEKGLDVDAQIPDDEIMVRGEQDSVTQICYNILDNAVKFAYTSSLLTIRIWKNDAKVFVAIRNQGDVIPAEELPLIFDRFHKSDKSRSMDKDGVGLGLYIVKSLLNSYGESISVTSENQQTEFIFTMTAAPAEKN